ncbi:kinase [Thraustotheca clavata]|uniref:Kinase n=1 Tax=Thraustotheca clavata TaxID=74557 RepID=A0A1W0ABL2_9STRA|nr:kinase [Thraustotheca clavata]
MVTYCTLSKIAKKKYLLGIYLAIGLGAGCAVIFAILSWYFCCCRPSRQCSGNSRKRHQVNYSMYDEPSPVDTAVNTANTTTFYVRNSDCDLGPLVPYRLSSKELETWHVLGNGSHGEVYLGEYRHDTVAIKQLYENQVNSEEVQHFVDEIVTMTRFDHPRIVSLIGVTWNAPPLSLQLKCVMEYMDQGNLQDFCTNSNDKSFTYRYKLTVTYQIATALAYIHAIPIIHRDLKSKNILLDGRKGAKLTDFATAKAVYDATTMTKGIGTFRWMAPEVLNEDRYSAAADIYSLGVIMTEMSSYSRPYSEQVDSHGKPISEVKIMQQVISGSLRPTFPDTVPQWWKQWSESCMAADPKERPTAQALADMIASFTKEHAEIMI